MVCNNNNNYNNNNFNLYSAFQETQGCFTHSVADKTLSRVALFSLRCNSPLPFIKHIVYVLKVYKSASVYDLSPYVCVCVYGRHLTLLQIDTVVADWID